MIRILIEIPDLSTDLDHPILSIDSTEPDRHGVASWTGESTEISQWLPKQFGMFGHYVGDYPCPADAIHALIISGKKYQVLEGQDILDLPIEPLPEGVVS